MRLSYNLARISLILAAIVIWQILSQYGIISSFVFSSPLASVTSLYLMITGHSSIIGFYKSLYATVVEVTLAFASIALIGIPTGILLGWNRFAQESVMPLMIAFFSIPSIVLYPLIYLIFGLGITSKVIFGVVVGLYAVLENTSAGAKQIPSDFVRLSQSLGFSRLDLLRKIVVPSALPYITSGLRLGFSFGFAGIIAGEYIASTSGLGQLIVTQLDLLNIGNVFAAILLVIGIATAINAVLILIERRESKFKVY
ncbi:MAG: ABC transporter permease [Nitrososphaerota archaeon]|nr:ABC transporter permease [Nitrososphaerota archaeon]